MMRLKKIILLAVALILTVAISVTATMAYLKKQTEVVQNTFAIGKVGITLDEAKVNEAGKLLDVDGNVWTEASGKDKAPRVYENEYKLVPGRTYVKDPTITVDADSQPCILFVVLYLPQKISAVIDYKEDLGKQITDNGWSASFKGNKVPDEVENRGDYIVFAYPQLATANMKIPFFSSITIDENVTGDQLKGLDLSEIRISAYAFQNEGTDNITYGDVWNIILDICDPFGLNTD
jgi:hypothetical protein